MTRRGEFLKRKSRSKCFSLSSKGIKRNFHLAKSLDLENLPYSRFIRRLRLATKVALLKQQAAKQLKGEGK
jgi:hypothetical protein